MQCACAVLYCHLWPVWPFSYDLVVSIYDYGIFFVCLTAFGVCFIRLYIRKLLFADSVRVFVCPYVSHMFPRINSHSFHKENLLLVCVIRRNVSQRHEINL
jgi:hypothetical protein